MDTSILDKYRFKEDDVHIQSIKRVYLLNGFELLWDNQIEVFCNCERTLSDGTRCIQTNDRRYEIEMGNAIWLIENAISSEEERQYYYQALIKRHNDNLEFERINGFQYDPVSKEKKSKAKTTRTKTKQTNSNDTPKERKETAAERKLKAHAIKINALMFKPKTV